jgi:hypothetical protein
MCKDSAAGKFVPNEFYMGLHSCKLKGRVLENYFGFFENSLEYPA